MRPPLPPRPLRDLPPPTGMTRVEGGAEFCVYADDADAVQVCLFDAGDVTGASERRLPLVERAHGHWFGFLPGVGPGQRYGLRVSGPWRPEVGQRHNPAKLLLDPYARAVEGEVTWRPEVFGHPVGATLVGDPSLRDDRDSAAYVPRAVVVDSTFDWDDDRPPQHSLSDSVIYEVHIRNLTMHLPGVPEQLRGTYAGMAHEATIGHLTSLGVTAVELLPVQAFTSEPTLVQRGLTNHWGYNTLGFFAPHAAYAAAGDPQGVLDEFKGMVKLLHRAGIEVILDVVYNHTCEQGSEGATLSWRGLDGRSYYRLDERGTDIDVTGCGNTLDLRHPVVCRMVLDSLRYWVQECHVDGFRFDLAVALARGQNDDYDLNHPFLVALRTDPVLSRVKNIAEPWDLGLHGWRTGQFPPPFSEWNDRYRDALRSFWLADLGLSRSTGGAQLGHGVQDLATRLAGSQDLFGRRDRGPIASVNFFAAHDGFTGADLTAYDSKHNGANGEGNRDGSDHNLSWNHGVEGPTTDDGILSARHRSMRNLLGTLLCSTGVPMINAGDEFGRTQSGTNNAYCQDNSISWFDWDLEPWQVDLLETTRFLTRLRRERRVLRQRTFFSGRQVADDGSEDIAWYDGSGQPMSDRGWGDPAYRTLSMYLDGAWLGEQSVLVTFHGGDRDAEVALPTPPGLTAYELLWDSAWDLPRDPQPVDPGAPIIMTAASMRIYAATDPT
ncbi:MAG: glycogen debranching protein GlgX [Lapillicoccus sp.]